MMKNVKVEGRVWRKLVELKLKWGKKRINEVIEELLKG